MYIKHLHVCLDNGYTQKVQKQNKTNHTTPMNKHQIQQGFVHSSCTKDKSEEKKKKKKKKEVEEESVKKISTICCLERTKLTSAP